jgi:hypothetical protein
MNIKMRKINSLNYIVFSIPRHFPELTTRDLVAKFIPDQSGDPTVSLLIIYAK